MEDMYECHCTLTLTVCFAAIGLGVYLIEKKLEMTLKEFDSSIYDLSSDTSPSTFQIFIHCQV